MLVNNMHDIINDILVLLKFYYCMMLLKPRVQNMAINYICASGLCMLNCIGLFRHDIKLKNTAGGERTGVLKNGAQ